jgi:ribosomal protein S18 acetylase RimI-like enzyme
MTGAVAGLRALGHPASVDLASTPDEAWCEAFLGEGFDPVDGACRIDALRRGRDTVFASVRDGDQAVAVGAGSFSHGWASIHGMRTARSRRGEGLAARVLAALAQAAEARGLARVFLQVEEDNAAARALYRRAGLTPAWRYFYWARVR